MSFKKRKVFIIKSRKQGSSIIELRGTVEAYLKVKEELAKLQKTQAELNQRLKEAVKKLHQSEDDKGNLILNLHDGEGASRDIILSKRTSYRLDEEKAEAILRKRGLYDAVVQEKTVTVFDEAMIEKLVHNEEISKEEFKKMMSENIVEALYVR